jgi:large subunit ribosomal protein L24
MVKKAQRRKSQNESGGIIEIEAAIDLSNVMFATKDGKPTRLGYRVENGHKVRFAKKTGETV